MKLTSDEPSALLVGAYERDNFGDLLFLLRTQKYLDRIESTASAPFPGDMAELLGRYIPGYADALSEKQYDAVWVVGGEVGGTTVTDAYRMSAPADEYSKFTGQGRSERAARLQMAAKMDVTASPYMPRMSANRATYGSALIINSVGVSGMRRLRGDRADETWGAMEEAGFVSVRDRASSLVLSRRGIEHTLAPDLVHSYGLQSVDNLQRKPGVALVQVKAKVLETFGTDSFARVLADSVELRKFEIRLFSAGSASGHDSLDLYQQVINAFRSYAPGRQIRHSEAVLPEDKLKEIAQSGLWLGTSLHGLIISSTFDVPRVALELEKLVRYAETWEEPMPTGVSLSDIDGAIAAALSTSAQSIRSGRSRELARKSHQNALAAVDVVNGSIDRREALAPLRERRAAEIERRRRSLVNRVVRLVKPAV